MRVTPLMRGYWRLDYVSLAVLALTAIALGLRFYDLGNRALHHDESLHAIYAWYLAEGMGYEHNPLTHGPLQFHLIAFLFRLIGDSEVSARIPAAISGGLLVAGPLILRRWLGSIGTVTASILLTFSPSLLYFSRFARNDLLIALSTFLLIVATWRYRDTGELRWLTLLVASLAFSFAIKETAYLTTAMLLLYLNTTIALSLMGQRKIQGLRRSLEMIAIFASAWLIAAFSRLMSGRLALVQCRREIDLIVLTGTLTLPLLAALSGPWFNPLESVLSLIVISAIVGLAWNPRRWISLSILFFGIVVPLYTTGFTNADGFLSGFHGSLDYWLSQQEVRRGDQPGFYYLMMLPLYEFLSLIPVLIAAFWLLWQGGIRTLVLASVLGATSASLLFVAPWLPWIDGTSTGSIPLYECVAVSPALLAVGMLLRRTDNLTKLLSWWFIFTLVALSISGEKMPWLTVHMTLPLTLLSARVALFAIPIALDNLRAERVSYVVRTASFRLLLPLTGSLLAISFLALLVLLSLYTTARVTYAHPDTPLEPLIYTQTSPDVPTLARKIEVFATNGPGHDKLMITVDTSSSIAWPWAWYLREFSGVRYLNASTISEEVSEGTITNGILIAALSTLKSDPNLGDQFAEQNLYRHRWWFPEEGYKSITLLQLLERLSDRSLLVDLASFYTHRIDQSTIGALEAAVLFPKQTPLLDH